MPRLTWNQYFINIAEAVSKRATCPRASVGAVLVCDERIIATGYNGSLASTPHCYEEGCITNNEGRHCTRAIHAEDNVIFQAARFGIRTRYSIMYYWDSRGDEEGRETPCALCMPAIVSAGIVLIVNRKLDTYSVNGYPFMRKN